MDDQKNDDDRIFNLIKTTYETKATMDYIKESLDEIKQEIKTLRSTDKCKDCEVSRRLEDHIQGHEKQLDRKWVIIGIVSASVLSFVTILLSILKVI